MSFSYSFRPQSVVFCILLFSQFNLSLLAQNDKEIFDAFLLNDTIQLEKILETFHSNNRMDESYAQYLYLYIGMNALLSKNQLLAQNGLTYLNKWTQEYCNNSHLKVIYESVVLSFDILLKNKSILPYGPKCYKLINKAIHSDPHHPIALLQKGNLYLHIPPILGGSKTKANNWFKKAEKELKKQKQSYNWLYIYTLYWNFINNNGLESSEETLSKFKSQFFLEISNQI